jgi:hypothetical protein
LNEFWFTIEKLPVPLTSEAGRAAAGAGGGAAAAGEAVPSSIIIALDATARMRTFGRINMTACWRALSRVLHAFACSSPIAPDEGPFMR